MKPLRATMLWVGEPQALIAQALTQVKQHYCQHSGCGSCSICTQITARQHYSLLFLETSKATYSRADLENIFAAAAFQRSVGEPFFCIITQAEKLSDSCANSLLKLLEEPPVGWHWLLLTDRPAQILDTVVSRCIVTEYTSQTLPAETHELFGLLTAPLPGDMAHFHQVLERSKITDYDARHLYDKVVSHWMAHGTHDSRHRTFVDFLHRLIEYPVMPGSSKFFFRTIYLALQAMVH